MKQIHESQRHFLLLFPPHFSCLSCVKLNKYLPIQTTTIRHCSVRGEKGQGAEAVAPPVPPAHEKNCRSFHCEAETMVQTSLRVTQDYRLHRSPVSGALMNYTYIDRNSIHYS